MSRHNFLMTSMLLTTLLSTASALHYKNKLDGLIVEQNDTITLATEVSLMARDIRIATYPTECDALTKKVIGEACDLGNYMEWAGPYMEDKTEKLLILLKEK